MAVQGCVFVCGGGGGGGGMPWLRDVVRVCPPGRPVLAPPRDCPGPPPPLGHGPVGEGGGGGLQCSGPGAGAGAGAPPATDLAPPPTRFEGLRWC